MTIEEVSRRARAEGISYGQYVFKHRVELAGKRPEPTEGLTSAVRCFLTSECLVQVNHPLCGLLLRKFENSWLGLRGAAGTEQSLERGTSTQGLLP